MRNDLNMRKGKMCAQASHASIAFLSRRINVEELLTLRIEDYNMEEMHQWFNGSFTKICLQVNSEVELDEIYNKAKEAGLIVHLVVDKGLTEFGGVPTKTCLAIGPHYSEKIDKITGNLKLM